MSTLYQQLQQAVAKQEPKPATIAHNRLLAIRSATEWLLAVMIFIVGINISAHSMPLFNPNLAIALVLLFWRGWRVIAGIACGLWLGLWLTQHSAVYSLTQALLVSSQATLILLLTHRFIGPLIPLATNKDLLGFVLITAVVYAITEPLGSVLGLRADYSLATILACLLITPAYLIWGYSVPQLQPSWRHWPAYTISSVLALSLLPLNYLLLASNSLLLAFAAAIIISLLARLVSKHLISALLLIMVILSFSFAPTATAPLGSQLILIVECLLGLCLSNNNYSRICP